MGNLVSVLNEYLPRLTAFHTVAVVGLHNGLFLSRCVQSNLYSANPVSM
jgi:hypothetical protein